MSMKKVLLAALYGLVLGLIFNYADMLWLLGFVALVPFLFIIYKNELNLKRALLLGWSFGFAYFGTVLVWAWHTLPLDWLGIESTIFALFSVAIFWGSVSLLFGLFIGLWAAGLQVAKKKLSSPVSLLIVAPLLWVLLEFAGTFGFSILTYGDGVLIGPHFSAGFVGYMLAANGPVLQLAKFGGVYLLSFVVVFVNCFAYWTILHAKMRKHRLIIAGIVVVLVVTPLALSQMTTSTTEGEPLSVALVHTHFPPAFSRSPEDVDERMRTYIGMLESITRSSREPDIVIFPEDARLISTLLASNRVDEFIGQRFEDQEVLVIDSARVEISPDESRSRMFYYNTKTKEISNTDKLFLAPQGEYIPFLYSAISRLVGQGKIITALTESRSYTAGDGVLTVPIHDTAIGGLFCSDVFSPVFYGNVTRSGAEVLLNVASQSWFHNSNTLYTQVRRVAQVRAVENNRYFVQASNFSPSFVISNTGEVLYESAWEGNELSYQEVYPIK